MKRTKLAVLLIMMFCIIPCYVSYHILAVESPDTKQKLVKSVQIEQGDCIWNIAKEYYKDENVNIKQYVREIKRCNNLSSDTIYAGQNLIIPYYE